MAPRSARDTVSRITEKVLGEMTEWLSRPLEKVYPVIFIDAMIVKVRDGQVTNKPVYIVIGVTVDGERDILGLWAGDGGEGAKFWLSVFTEIKNRGVKDVCIAVCDGLKDLPEAITTTWELATVQACVIHLIRNTFRFASRKYWDEMSRDTQHPQRPPLGSASASSTQSGASSTRQSASSGRTPGASSSRSWTTTSRSAG
jgi:putative transposase